MDKDFTKRFNAARDVLNRSDDQLASALKVSPLTISHWTQGLSTPHPYAEKGIFDTLAELLYSRENL